MQGEDDVDVEFDETTEQVLIGYDQQVHSDR